MRLCHNFAFCEEIVAGEIFASAFDDLDPSTNQIRKLLRTLWVVAEFIPDLAVLSRHVPKAFASGDLPEILNFETHSVRVAEGVLPCGRAMVRESAEKFGKRPDARIRWPGDLSLAVEIEIKRKDYLVPRPVWIAVSVRDSHDACLKVS